MSPNGIEEADTQGFLKGMMQKVNEFIQRNIREKIQALASILQDKTWVQCETERKSRLYTIDPSLASCFASIYTA